MNRQLLVRNSSAREYLDTFLVSAAASIFMLRLGLHITGYPSVGGSKYHVAHMLYGGLAMMLALFLNFAYLGKRTQKIVAILGGIGFGVFIDEVGKFITRDNDYFFKPAVGIIYAIFVGLYLLVSFITRRQKMTNQEYQLNALRQLEDAVHHDFDAHERTAAHRLLLKADQKDPLTKQLTALLYELPVARNATPNWLQRSKQQIAKRYEHLWQVRGANRAVRIFFIVETIIFIVAVFAGVYSNVDDVTDFIRGNADYGHSLIIGQLVSTLFAAGLIARGVFAIKTSRYKALEWFRYATLVNLLLTEFFLFSRIQFGAVPSFLFNLALYILLDAVLAYERKSTITQSS